jgi:uncharacterized protein YjbJ (UPF0337 family)
VPKVGQNKAKLKFVEAAIGKATDNPAKVAQGQAKQAEADLRNAKEDLR